ncbi:arginine--tRNA ligase [Candidatus Pacearchaeota archaeon]|nr:arginine--tRNA ligase [Candidatus Pacearchaeota archaeon]
MKEKIADLMHKKTGLPKEQILSLIEIPKDSSLGDYAFPCFSLSILLKKNPVEIAKEISSDISSPDFENIQAVGPYLNFFLDRKHLASSVIQKILKERSKYGSSTLGKGKTIVIDLSAPNIAKPFGIGHLRSTIIGNAISNLAKSLGYKTIKINYLGDWGTQFGMLIAGYKKWGKEQELKKNPIKHLQDIYVKANVDESMEQEARDWFRKLEAGDKDALKFWKKFRDLSLKEFNKIYSLLNIKFDVLSGESLYNKKMDATINLLKSKKLIKKDKGAEVVDLNLYGIGVCLIRKSDGATLYATRDITAAIDRYNSYKFDKMIYEVGSEQSLHFKQFFKVLELAGFKWANNCVHVAHGLYLDRDGKKFATRKGKTISMSEILDETIELARREIENRYQDLSKKEIESRAKSIALSAILYGDLKNYRMNDIIFDIERFLSFEGDTGPYLLYTFARARNILRKAKYKPSSKIEFSDLSDLEKRIVFALSQFPSVVENSYMQYSPNLIANYSFQLAQLFNEFYHKEKVIGAENEHFRLSLVDSFSQVLKNALSLLNISVIERM